jgi:hypothetical protein
VNRRSILSALCTGALALLAPVVAWASRRPRPRTLAEAFAARPHVGEPETREIDAPDRAKRTASVAELRALLAEARERLREDHYLMAYDDGEPAQMGDAFRIDHGVLIARIDDALKGHERNA